MVDRLIVLFESTDTDFSTNGIGSLTDAISCSVSEGLNDEYELEMIYPMTGTKYEEILYRRLLYCKPNPFSNPQPFRIYGLSKPHDGKVTVKARHISYDMSGYTVSPFSAGSILTAFQNMVANCDTTCPFTFTTDKTTEAVMSTSYPLSMRKILGGVEGSILDTYRGEYEFDGFTVKLWNHRGENRGATIRYGKNLRSLKQEENCNNVYTHVRPYYYKEPDGETGGLVELPEKLMSTGGTYNYVKILPLDLTDQFEDGESVTAAKLREKANAYMAEHNMGSPEVSLNVSFEELSRSSEYGNLALLEMIRLGDYVTVQFPKLGVNSTAKVIKTSYDVLARKYKNIELGEPSETLSTTVANTQKKADASVNKVALETAIINATNAITGNSGGYVVFEPKNQPSRILIMDTPDMNTAVDVWQWNLDGLGHSSNGINGPYDVAITQAGSINASFLTSGTINGNIIEAGSVTSGAISQEYTATMESKIGDTAAEVTQQFTAADAQLANTIQSTFTAMLNDDVAYLENTISQLRQTIDSLNISFTTQVMGGMNLITNSSGLNGVTDEWHHSGVVEALQDSVAEAYTVSGSMFKLYGNPDPNQGTLYQDIKVVMGQTYTFSCKSARDTAARCIVTINNGENEIVIFDAQAESDWQEYRETFVAAGDSVTIMAITYGSSLYIADLLLTEGNVKTNWMPAPNEIYTTNVKIDKRGINITNSESSTQTIIDNTQFAVKHQNSVVLTVNKDMTTLRKTDITDELTVGKGRFIPIQNGLNFILLD